MLHEDCGVERILESRDGERSRNKYRGVGSERLPTYQGVGRKGFQGVVTDTD